MTILLIQEYFIVFYRFNMTIHSYRFLYQVINFVFLLVLATSDNGYVNVFHTTVSELSSFLQCEVHLHETTP